MKKLLLGFIAVAGLAPAVNAQAPDMGFENWANVPFSTTVQDPVGWASFNVLVAAGMPQTVFKETTAPYAGTASVKVVTDVIPSSVMIPNPYKPSENLDTIGSVAMGSTQITTPYVKYGKPYAYRPAVLNFACKYSPMPGDSAFVLAYLTKWNGTSRDTIAWGRYATGAASSAYSIQTLTLTYDVTSTTWSDTQMVFISSSVYNHDGAKKGSTFYVDQLAWSGYVSTDDIDGMISNVTIAPNPASSRVNLKCSVNAEMVEVMDITGRKLGMFQMNNNEVTLETENYVPGLYIFNIINDKKMVINRGKFEVAR